MKIPRVDIVSAHWKLELNITSCFSFCEAAIFVHILTLLIMDFSSSISKSSKTVGTCFLRIFSISIATLLISHCAFGEPLSSIMCRHSLKFAVTTIWLSTALGRTYLASSFGMFNSTNFAYVFLAYSINSLKILWASALSLMEDGSTYLKLVSSTYLCDCWVNEHSLCRTNWWVKARETPEILKVADVCSSTEKCPLLMSILTNFFLGAFSLLIKG